MVKEVSNVPSVLSLAILCELEPLYVLKLPPTMIFPSAWTARENTSLLNEDQMLKEVSNVPSVLSLAILVVVAPLYVPKLPPTTIFPSHWIVMVRTVGLNQLPILKEVSLVPSVLSLMI
jgi:hypothetical protein